MSKKTILVLLIVGMSIMAKANGAKYEVSSPDGKITVNIQVKDKISYSVEHDSRRLLLDSPLSDDSR